LNFTSAAQKEAEEKSKTSLSVKGFSESGEILFEYANPNQNLTQTFGFNLNYYKPHQQLNIRNKTTDEDIDIKALSQRNQLSKHQGEGAYTFNPEWEGPNGEI